MLGMRQSRHLEGGLSGLQELAGEMGPGQGQSHGATPCRVTDLSPPISCLGIDGIFSIYLKSSLPGPNHSDPPEQPTHQVTKGAFPSLALAGSPSSFGKGQAGGSHGGALSLPPARGCMGIRASFLTRSVPSRPSTDGLPLPPQLLLPSHPSSQLGKGSLSLSHPLWSAWVQEGGGTRKGPPRWLGGCAGAQGAGQAAATWVRMEGVGRTQED